MSSLFDECATEIIQSIFKNSHFSTHSRRLFVQAAIIYTPSIQSTWSSAADCPSCLCELHAGSMSEEISCHNKELSVSGLRRLVSAASNMDSLCRNFLQTYLDRIHALRPTHYRHPKPRIDPYASPKYDIALAGPAYIIRDTGPPSWVECQRIHRALWHLFVFLELKFIMPSLRTKPDSQLVLGDSTFVEFWKHLPKWEIDEMECVNEYLLGLNNDTPLIHLPFVQQKKTTPWMALTPTNDCIGTPCDQAQKAVALPSPGFRWFNIMSRRNYPETNSKSLTAENWHLFRRLGLEIWDLKRMCRLEMYNHPLPGWPNPSFIPRRFSTQDLIFTWMSIV